MSKKPNKNNNSQAGSERSQLGKRLRILRKRQGWTLTQVSEKTGLAVSTLSKAERGEMSMTYDKFMQLATGLGLDVGELFSTTGKQFSPKGVAITRIGEAKRHETDTYVYEMPATGMHHKQMTPMFGRIKAHDIKEFKEIVHHPGEEFVFVLKGTLRVHIEGQEEFDLRERECAYFDSTMGHAYVSAGEEDAEILVVCWQPPQAMSG